MIEPTYSTTQAAALVGRGSRWVRKAALRDEIGTFDGRAWRFTAPDVADLRAMVNPNERRGRPKNR